ncbi:M48 family metalloprotease [Nocardiopsis dassonvillei]|uniref:M48 family metalloprotease n=1 Tax=Nocardiopsis dassonvillei TaxID=2014 RepID=UPI0020A54517|nr:M48 family metalloprotease [Nocardiopsis dassonvillei]MCP3013877.1 M48 family metalloprotease [Nocardiopsis dassonvillei]
MLVQTPLAEAISTVPGSPRGYNPFLLPSATSIRFSLIILVAAVSSMYIAYWFVPILPLLGADTTGSAARAACTDQAHAGIDRLSDQALLNGFVDCVAAADRQVMLWMVAPGLVWAFLTIVVYALYPILLQRRLRPIRLPEDSGVRAAQREVDAALGGVRKRIKLLPTQGTAGGARVFGAFGRYRIAVDTSLLVLRESGELDERALAVIRHEMAHLRNQDVDIAYLTMSSWWAFVVLTTGPLALYMFAALYSIAVLGSSTILLSNALPGLLLTVLALLLLQSARARILRTREHYADVRAAETSRVEKGLRDLLARSGRTRSGLRLRRWQHKRHRYHPSHRSRLDVLDDPRRLTTVSGVDLAIAGLTLGAAHLHLSAAGGIGISQGSEGGISTAVLMGMPVGALITAIVWNAVHATPDGAQRWGRAATALTAGILLGLLPPIQFGLSWLVLLLSNPLFAVVSVFVLWGVCLLFLRWAALCAGAWLSTARHQQAACFMGILCGAVVFGCGFGIWVHFNGILGAEASGGLVGLLGAPVAAFMASWRFPTAVGCATVFAFIGLIRGSRVQGLARHPLTPFVAGCALTGLYAVLLLVAVVVGRAGGFLPLALILLLVLLAAAAASIALGAWSSSRGYSPRGTGTCLAAAVVLTLLALEPLTYAVVFEGMVCLLTEAPSECPGVTTRAVSDGYAEATFSQVSLPVMLLLCGIGASAGSWLRSVVGARRHAPGGLNSTVPWQRRHTVAVLAVAAAATVVLGSVVGTVAQREAPRIDIGARPFLLSQVEPDALSRDDTCTDTETSMNLRVDDSESALLSSDAEAGAVTLASSSDQVLAAFGRAALGESGFPSRHLFDAVRSYCQWN